MKRLFTFLLSALICNMIMAQAPSAVVKKASVSPVIDGMEDAVWSDANVYNIDKPFTGETPTVGTSTWQALWDSAGIYVLLKVDDDVWDPVYAGTDHTADYEYDHPELYFDVNYVLKDGLGPQTDGNGGGNGHYQFAPQPVMDSISGGSWSSTGSNGIRFSYNVTDPSYMVEYFIPFTKLLDGNGVQVDQTGTIGFDVTLCDDDAVVPLVVRNREVWANIGTIAESWNNMDDCGTITLEGAEAGVYVDVITLTDGAITTDNGTLQMMATIAPSDATNKVLKWTLTNGTGKASISSTGLVTAIADGTVTVMAAATDGGYTESNEATITVSGQVIDQYDIWNSLNQVRNWNFDTNLDGWGNYVDTSIAGTENQLPPVVVDGVVQMQCGLASTGENWHYQLNEQPLNCEPNVPYTVKFKSWASADATPCALDFEDTPALNYNRYGATSDPEAVGGRSEWHYNVSSEPAWFTFHVVFDQLVDGSVQKIQWMNSLSNNIVYLDSVLLIKDDDLVLSNKQLASSVNAMKVYPNPVGTANILTVSLSVPGAKVSVYNAIGQKLLEKVTTNSMAKFDVTNLRKGMYFVKSDDGTTQKFIR